MVKLDGMSTPTPINERSQHASPTRLLLSFLGVFVLDHPHRQRIDARVIIDVLASLGISEGASRVTLNRMVNNGLLDRQRSGRTAAYGLTEKAKAILHEGGLRVVAEEPFERSGDKWTLLSYSVPESKRDLRHRLRSQLLWAGFGRIRDGLWLAPGIVDVSGVLETLHAESAIAFAFVGNPTESTANREFISAAWDLDALRARHDEFIRTWSQGSTPTPNAVAARTAMAADWLSLLRADPGLPREYLPGDWPADMSAKVYKDNVLRLSAAEASLDEMIAYSSLRR